MLYSKNKEELIEKIVFIMSSEICDKKYKDGLILWREWFEHSNVNLPQLECNLFYRAYVSNSKVFAVQIWENIPENEIDVWKTNLFASSFLEDNTDDTKIIKYSE